MRETNYDEIVGFVVTNKLYRNPGLTLYRLSKLMDVNIDCLGSTIKDGCGKRFQELITELRIKEASDLLRQKSHEGFSVEAIGRMAGFENRLLFRSLFKERTGYSPMEYQRLNTSSC